MTFNEQKVDTAHDFTNPARLHPIAILFNFLYVMKETIYGLGLGLIFTIKESVFYFFIFAAVFLFFLLVSSVLSWARFTYRIENKELRIEQGVFVRKKRYISLNRIHKIDLTANVIHRLLKLTKVQIDTASSGEGAEVQLRAIDTTVARELQQALKINDIKVNEFIDSDGVPVDSYEQKRIVWRRLFIAGSTSGNVGIILIALLAFLSQVEEFVPDHLYNAAYVWLVARGVIFTILLAVTFIFLLWLASIAGTMVKYGNFTIEKRPNELLIKRGLLETKQLTIPFDRIQAIGIEQNIIRQPFGYVRLFAVVAGGSFDRLEPFPVLFPILTKKEATEFLTDFIPDYTPTDAERIPLGKRGRKYYLFQSTVFFALLLVPIGYFLPTLLWLGITLVIASLLLGYLRHRDGYYALEENRLTLTMRRFNKVTIMTHHRRIQSIEQKQHRLQRAEQLATVKASLIGSAGLGTHYSLKHLTEQSADDLFKWYSYRKRVEKRTLKKNEDEPLSD